MRDVEPRIDVTSIWITSFKSIQANKTLNVFTRTLKPIHVHLKSPRKLKLDDIVLNLVS